MRDGTDRPLASVRELPPCTPLHRFHHDDHGTDVQWRCGACGDAFWHRMGDKARSPYGCPVCVAAVKKLQKILWDRRRYVERRDTERRRKATEKARREGRAA